MISNELRKGISIELDGELYQVHDYHHIKPGRGYAQVPLFINTEIIKGCLATYPPDPLPLIREGGVVREGRSPSLKISPPHAKNTSPYLGEGD